MSNPDGKYSDEEYRMPCAEAVLAGTLALMTGHAQGQCCDAHRQVLERKIADNLAELAGEPLLSPHFRAALWSLHGRWERMQDARAARRALPDPRLWHAPPESVQ